jgi:hypothetical protein
MRNYTVVCEWKDANGVEDADEVSVRAESANAARSKAKAKWTATVGARWPSCRLRKVFSLTPEKSADFE